MENLAQIVEIAPLQPDEGAVAKAVDTLRRGGVIAFPTDTLYGIGCAFGQPKAAAHIHGMRGSDGKRRPLTFLLPDIGEIARWARVSGTGYTVLERIFPGPYCVELAAGPAVPNPFMNANGPTIGVRVPDNTLCEKLLWLLGAPILTATAKARDGHVLTSAEEIQREYGADLDMIIDAGQLTGPPSTVVSLVDDWVQVLREGRGPASRVLTA